jgi:amino acid permease
MSADTRDGVKPTPATTDIEATVLQGNENHDANLVTTTEEENLQRGLHERHLSMQAPLEPVSSLV